LKYSYKVREEEKQTLGLAVIVCAHLRSDGPKLAYKPKKRGQGRKNKKKQPSTLSTLLLEFRFANFKKPMR
jgi:hypothetical protein